MHSRVRRDHRRLSVTVTAPWHAEDRRPRGCAALSPGPALAGGHARRWPRRRGRVTPNLRTVPAVLASLAGALGGADEVEVRGEIYMPRAAFARLNRGLEARGEEAFARAMPPRARCVRRTPPSPRAALSTSPSTRSAICAAAASTPIGRSSRPSVGPGSRSTRATRSMILSFRSDSAPPDITHAGRSR